ncbi:cilia- and flagella-associated protein 69-like isoform X2 [Bolinopsis microptera]|uniref:cilia- and flagella-associated protein 69-like isoform X2 n=1 Tax=Bolinopsis microptera TaxID=2820187 RepID=UPI00307A8BEE
METIEVQKFPLMGSNMQYDTSTRSFIERQQPPKLDTTLEKVLQLLTDPHSTKVKERHTKAVKRICDRYFSGFYLKDLGLVYKIVESLVEHMREDEDYTSSLVQIIMLCGKSFLKEKASDDAVYGKDLAEFLVKLVRLIELPKPMVQIAVTHCIGSLYCTPVPIYNDGPQACRHELNIKAIEDSNVVKIFASELKKMEDDTVYQEILHLLLFLSLSSSNCDCLLDMDIISVISKNMVGACGSSNSKLLQLSVEVLWNVIEYGNPDKVQDRFETSSVVKSLYYTFCHFIKKAKTKQDLQLRNDVMSVTQVLVTRCPSAPLLECGFIKILTLVATSSEVKTTDELMKGFSMKPQNDDFELKKAAWTTLIGLAENDAMRQVMIDVGLLTALFDYVKPNDSVCSVEWTSAQYEELQLQALSSLETLSPLCLEEYMRGHGNTRLIMLLEWACLDFCYPEGDYGGHGNSFFGEGGYQTRRAQLRYTIRVLLAVVRTGNENVIQDLCDQGLIGSLLVVLKMYKDTEVPIELSILSNTLLILSVVCETDSHRKATFGDEGVDLLLNFLSLDSEKFSSGLGYHKLLLSSVNAIWCCVSFMNQDLFLERGGIPILLDLLEKCPPSMQNLVLGALLDLTEDARALPHVVTWRGTGQKTAVSLLIQLWRAEEHAMGVKRDRNHIMADPATPLQGAEQLMTDVSAHALSSTPTLAILDVADNMRAKIYAMLFRIGFDNLPPVSAKDQITLTLIENYLDFKVGEVWEEIIAELMLDNITPIKSDREALREIQTIIAAKSEAVKRHQMEILDRESRVELEDEQACYEQIKFNFKQWEQQNASRINFINKTSDYETLQISKQRQSALAEKSKQDPPGIRDTVEHNTLLKMLTTTVHSGRHINVPLSDNPNLVSPHKVLPGISPTRSNERSVITQ